jgi:hypothetical protein
MFLKGHLKNKKLQDDLPALAYSIIYFILHVYLYNVPSIFAPRAPFCLYFLHLIDPFNFTVSFFSMCGTFAPFSHFQSQMSLRGTSCYQFPVVPDIEESNQRQVLNNPAILTNSAILKVIDNIKNWLTRRYLENRRPHRLIS